MATPMPVHGIAGLPPRPSFTYDNIHESHMKQNRCVIIHNRQGTASKVVGLIDIVSHIDNDDLLLLNQPSLSSKWKKAKRMT